MCLKLDKHHKSTLRRQSSRKFQSKHKRYENKKTIKQYSFVLCVYSH